MYNKCRKTQIRLNAATLKESPAKGYQHFAKSAMKGQKSPQEINYMIKTSFNQVCEENKSIN